MARIILKIWIFFICGELASPINAQNGYGILRDFSIAELIENTNVIVTSTYHLTHPLASASLLRNDCKTTLPTTESSYISGIVEENINAEFSVEYPFYQTITTTIPLADLSDATNAVFKEEVPNEWGYIWYCEKSYLTSASFEGEIVAAFTEHKYELYHNKVNQGFLFEDAVSLVPISDPDELDINVDYGDLEGTIYAFQCESITFAEISDPPPLELGQTLNICIESRKLGVIVNGIQDLTVSSSSYTEAAIVGSAVSSSTTTTTTGTSSDGSVRSFASVTMTTDFFDDTVNDDGLQVFGSVLLASDDGNIFSKTPVERGENNVYEFSLSANLLICRSRHKLLLAKLLPLFFYDE